IFTQFRKEVERFVPVRDPLPTPGRIPAFTTQVKAGVLPELTDFGHDHFVPDSRAVLPFKGGETAGLERLRYYLWDTDLVKTYKETRNGLIGSDYSSKLSPWLAQGCLSPKQVYHELKRYEAERGANKSTYWLFFELLWRDFFRLQAKKHGDRIFLRGGTKGEEIPGLRNDWRLFGRWLEGETGVPFIDANMRELNLTGFMSNRGRQNVASFLVKDLKVNWQMGAEYFESLLIDYDVASNWGNWNYVAGVGSDPRENRYFNIIKQAKRYDPQGDYVRLWVPELAELPSAYIHTPDQLQFAEQEAHKVKIGSHYPQAIVPTKKWERNT
ncbi:MAG: DASH family cryptochrome, partial [Bacteroidetes bacterium]